MLNNCIFIDISGTGTVRFKIKVWLREDKERVKKGRGSEKGLERSCDEGRDELGI